MALGLAQYYYVPAQQKNGDVASAKRTLQTALKFNPSFPGAEKLGKP
jgi:hypothetical protein